MLTSQPTFVQMPGVGAVAEQMTGMPSFRALISVGKRAFGIASATIASGFSAIAWLRPDAISVIEFWPSIDLTVQPTLFATSVRAFAIPASTGAPMSWVTKTIVFPGSAFGPVN